MELNGRTKVSKKNEKFKKTGEGFLCFIGKNLNQKHTKNKIEVPISNYYSFMMVADIPSLVGKQKKKKKRKYLNLKTRAGNIM